ncbi:MAG: hypothetical protein KKD28_07225 [Chloroflexi bacterium]|nr:hypothetical protein [Chloroflexota bacterium]MBU1661248.1 hypothetical protein [Chloroflexota bacterium]
MQFWGEIGHVNHIIPWYWEHGVPVNGSGKKVSDGLFQDAPSGVSAAEDGG